LLRHATPEDPDVVTVADVPGDEPELLEVSVLNLDVIGAGQQAEPLQPPPEHVRPERRQFQAGPGLGPSGVGQQGAGASEAPTTATTSTVRP
jgi:hypothetical protein